MESLISVPAKVVLHILKIIFLVFSEKELVGYFGKKFCVSLWGHCSVTVFFFFVQASSLQK